MNFTLKRLITLLLFVTLYCIAEEISYYKDPTLIRYIDVFMTEAKDRGIKLDDGPLEIEFVDKLPGQAVGMCTRWSIGPKMKIEILRSYWEDWMNPTDRWITIAHESGHCFLHLDHNDKGIHIMNSILMDSRYYTKALLDEEFNDGKVALGIK